MDRVAGDKHVLLAAQEADWLVAGVDGIHLVTDDGCDLLAADEDAVLLVALGDRALLVHIYGVDGDAVLLVALNDHVLPGAVHEVDGDLVLLVALDDHVLPVADEDTVPLGELVLHGADDGHPLPVAAGDAVPLVPSCFDLNNHKSLLHLLMHLYK